MHGLRPRIALSLLPAVLACSGYCRAAEPREVIIVEPDASSCVVAAHVAAAIANAGAYQVRVLEDVSEAPLATPAWARAIRIEGPFSRLRVRAWGIRAGGDTDDVWPWPAAWYERPADVDREIAARDCVTATETITAFLVSLLSPPAADGVENEGREIVQVLERAQRELGPDSGLLAGVLRTELGLTLIVEDSGARCRRGTWLQISGPPPHAGQSVDELRRHVLACLDELRTRDERAFQQRLTARSEQGERDRRFGLPGATGALVSAVGATVAYVALARLDDAVSVLPYTALPAVAGGIAGYVAPEHWREPLWLSGYWATVAGSSLAAGAHGGAGKPVLVGSLLAAGATSSAALSLFDAFSSDPTERLPAWSIALPAAAGATLAGLGLLVDGRGQNSIQIAAIGGLSALAPALWLAAAPARGASDGVGAREMRVAVSPSSALLCVSGEL